MEPITISLPIYLKYGVKKPKTFALNLNVYRNTHFQILNNMKVLFEKSVKKSLDNLPQMSKVTLTYTLFFGSKREVDTSNVCCIVDKFFSDTLVNASKLLDDNHNVISEITYRFGGVDTQNPRCDVTLSDYEVVAVKEEPMRIILVQSEIEAALRAYVFSQINVAEGQDISIDFKNTRGEDGATAEINITKPDPAKVAEGNAQRAPTASPLNPVVKSPFNSEKAATTSPAPAAKPTEPTSSEPEQSAEPASTNTEKLPDLSQEDKTLKVPSFLQREPLKDEPKEEPAAPSKSLFGGLTKPVNQPKE